jgi:tetratricopeptide (TPR) repeat protein
VLLQLLEEDLAAETKLLPTLRQRAEVYEELGREYDADGVWSAILARTPHDPDLLVRRGRLRPRAGPHDAAATDLDAVLQALTATPERLRVAGAWSEISEEERRVGNGEQAFVAADRAISLGSARAGDYARRGLALRRLGLTPVRRPTPTSRCWARRGDFTDASLGTSSIAFVLDCHGWSNDKVRVTARNVSASIIGLVAARLSVQVVKRRIPSA